MPAVTTTNNTDSAGANTARTPGRTNYIKNPDQFSPKSPSMVPNNNNNNTARNNNLLGNSTANRVVLPPMTQKQEQQKQNATVTPTKTSPRLNNNTTSNKPATNVIPSPPASNEKNNNNDTRRVVPVTSTVNNNNKAKQRAAESSSSASSTPPHQPQSIFANKKLLAERMVTIRTFIKDGKAAASTSVKETQLKKAIELLDELIGSPTYADLPMFDENHPSPPEYDNKLLFELLSLRIDCWMWLNQFGRVLDDISNAMRVDLQTALLRADFVVPKLKSLYDLGDIAIGLQVATSLEVAVARNGALIDEVLEWKRKFVLASRKKNEVVESNHHGIVIGGRRFAAGAPLCRHGCPDKEPASFFQMEIVVNQMSCQDTFLALHRLYTEYDGARLAWKHWARQELRKAIDAAANENWKQCRDSTRQYLLATEIDRTGEAFVDAMDTLGRIPNPVYGETTARFFKQYDRSMSTTDDLVELLVEVSKPFCSCMNEIHELRSRRVKTQKQQDGAGAAAGNADALSPNGNTATTTTTNGIKTRKGVTLTYGVTDGVNDNENVTTTAVVPTVPSPAVSAQLMKVKANIRDAANLREEGNLLFLARKFRSALKCYEDAIELDSSNTELFFNKTAALYELEQFDSVVAACDRTLDNAAKNQLSDRTLGAKILARRADAMWKLGALDEAVLNYQESLDAWENETTRSKMIDCSIALSKKKLATVMMNGKNDEAKEQQQEKTETNSKENNIVRNIISYEQQRLRNQKPPAPFAACVIVEPISSRSLGKTGHLNISVFPTQIATPSHFFQEAIPIPLMKYANFPFAVIPCVFTTSSNGGEHQNNNNINGNTANNNNNNNISTGHTSATYNVHHNNNNTNNNGSSSSISSSSAENFFATLATRSLTSDLTDQPMISAHLRPDLWSNCGSVIVLRKDFKPVTCRQVVQLFQLLLDVWGLGEEHNNNNNNNNFDVSTVVVDENTVSKECKMRKKNRLELFSSQEATTAKILEYCGKIPQEGDNDVDEKATEKKNANNNNNNDNEEDEDNDLLPGTHVINTFSEKHKLVKHSKGRNVQQARMLKEQGNKLYKGRRFRTALLRYDEGLLLDATSPELLYNRAAALIELGMFDIAVDSCQRAADAVNVQRTNNATTTNANNGLLEKIAARKNLALRKLGRFDALEMLGQPESSVLAAGKNKNAFARVKENEGPIKKRLQQIQEDDNDDGNQLEEQEVDQENDEEYDEEEGNEDQPEDDVQ